MGAFAAFVSFVRRRGRLYYDIPEPLAYLRVREAAPGLFGGIALCMLLGWASYAGVVNSSLDKDELSMQLAGGLDLDRAGFRGGFILAVLSTVLSGVLAGLSYVYHDEGEAERAAQDAALAHAVATGGAVPGAGAGVGQQVGMPSSMASSASGAAAPSAPFPPTGTPPTANNEEHPFAEGGGQDYEAAQGQGHSAAGSSTVNPVTAAMAQAAPSSPPADQTDDSMGNPFGEEPAL